MTGKTHAAVGLCGAAFLLVPKASIETSIIGLGFVVLGSYATDADLKMSKAGHVISDIIHMTILLLGLYLADTYLFHYNVMKLISKNMPGQLKVIGILFVVSSIVFGRITGHRKYMHSLLGFATMNIGVWLIAGKFVIWFGLGYALHMVLDLLNEKPEYLLFPLPVGGFCLSLVSSRGIANTVISVISYTGFLCKIIYIYNLKYFHMYF
ncbi:metal-dependent hydrolase [Clostridium sp. BJN0013]|uniref:metal-dependent hydrolase n=1 Tax=Clostridium sp. BJN0013 TaxID=3236840 RepID=UPI0034C656B6